MNKEPVIIYSESLVLKARELAFQAHQGQVDKAGTPYTEHLEFVASHVDGIKEKCVAYLHDTLEDTDIPRETLLELFGKEIVDAICSMTHADNEDYFEYIRRLSNNPLSAAVKKADLTHNMKLDRLPEITDKDLRRLEKYKKAYQMLQNPQL